jgi:hypothetical protein
MNITITISDTELSANDKALIKDCLALTTNPELATALTKICKTSFLEYCKMFKEKGIPTRADEVMQERLFFLLNNYYMDRLPSENEISTIFQLTPSQSRTLLRNTKSRYRTKISIFINNSLKTILQSAAMNDETSRYEFVCLSSVMIEELNLIISQKGPTLEQINKIKGKSSKYECAEDTYDLLKAELGLL